MTATTARTVTASVRRTVRDLGMLDAVVKVSTRQDGIAWETFVETVTKAQATDLAKTLAATYPAAKATGGMAFFGVTITQPISTPESAPVVEPAGGRMARLRAERASLNMVLVDNLVERLFQAWRQHNLKGASIAVREEHGHDQALLEWVDHYLSQRIGQVAPVCLAPIPGTRNYLLDKVYV